MRKIPAKHDTLDVLNLILQVKGGANDQANINEALYNIKKKMTEVEDAAANDSNESPYALFIFIYDFHAIHHYFCISAEVKC